MEREVWDEEYSSVQSIPSSNRFKPSLTLQKLLFQNPPTGNVAIDIGCGNGRNLKEISNYMNETIGIDYSKQAISLATEPNSDHHLLQAKIPTLPIKADTADALIDSYVSCHFISQSEVRDYFDEIERVASEGAQLYWIGVGTEDEYYSQFTQTNKVLDPVNNIAKRLYSLENVKNSFGRGYTVETAKSLSFQDTVNGTTYERDILVGIFRI